MAHMLRKPARTMARAVASLLARTTVLGAVISLSALPVMADVGGEMNSFFNKAGAAANVTGPSAYNGQSAGYYSGGSLWSRFPSKTINPVNIQLPKASAGCGGIDLFSGSFSFINSDEIVAMLKATANNAIGFAFQLAIDSISAQIGGVMKDMAQRAQQMNQHALSSCQEAQAAVGALWPAMDGASKTICENVGVGEGFFSDRARAMHDCEGADKRRETLAGSTDPQTRIVKSRNYTWNALMSKSVTKPGTDYAEFLMTMVGTIIYDQGPSAKEPGTFRFIAPASWDMYTALLDGTTTSPTQVWRCDTTDADGCLSPVPASLTIPADTAFRNRVMKMMTSMGSKIRTNTALSGEEISLLGMTSIPLYKILVVNEAAHFSLSASDMGTLSEIIAVDVLMAQMDRMLDDISKSQAGATFVGTKEFDAWRSQVDTVRTALSRKSQGLSNDLSKTYQIVENTQRLEATLKNTMSPQMTASLRFGRGLSAQGIR